MSNLKDLEKALERLKKGEIDGFEFRQCLLGHDVPRYRVRRFGTSMYALHETLPTGAQGSGDYQPMGEFGAVFKMHLRKTDSKKDAKIPYSFIEIEALTPQSDKLEVHELEEDITRIEKLRGLYR